MKQIKSLCVYCLAWFNLFFLNGCIKEKIEVSKPKTESLTMQLHNLNASGNLILDGTAPDIYYFQQNEDGTYTFSLSSSYKLDNLGFNWTRKYQVGTLNENGSILGLGEGVFPAASSDNLNRYTFYGIGNDFLYNDVPNRYTAENLKITYPVSGDRLFETVNLDNLQRDPLEYVDGVINDYKVTDWVHGLTRTSDGIFLINKVDPVSSIFAYSKFYDQDNRVYKVLDPSFVAPNSLYYDDSEGFSAYVTNRGDDAYFINISPVTASPYPYGVFINNQDVTFDCRPQMGSQTTTCAGPSSSYFIDLLGTEVCFPNYNTVANGRVVTKINNFNSPDIEIRFGANNRQIVPRIAAKYEYNNSALPSSFFFDIVDQVEVPFEVWDVSNDKWLAAYFIDVNNNGRFDVRDEYTDTLLYSGNNNLWKASKAEQIIIPWPYEYNGGADYQVSSRFRCGDNQDPFAFSNTYIISPILTPGNIWDPASIPETTVAIKKYQGGGWKTRLIKVNESGVTEVKRDFLQGNLINISKVVPFNNGYALLFNGTPPSYGAPPAEIILIDENFNQYQSHSIGLAGESEHKMIVSGNTVYYAAGPKGLRLVAIRNGQKIEKVLDFLGQDKILKEPAYNITSTKSGGIAILAWVRPTANTRDLLFMEFDENLNLVKKSN